MKHKLKSFYGLLYAIMIAVVFIIGCGGKGFSENNPNTSSYKYSTDIDALLYKHDLCRKGYSIEPDSAVVYTLMALDEIQNKYGFGSREYVEVFTDYMIPDCMDNTNLLTEYIYPVVTTGFCPDSLYVGKAYYELGRVLSQKHEYQKADQLFSFAAELTESLEDSLMVEVERAINWQKRYDGVLYFCLHPLIDKTETLRSPYKETLLLKIYSLLGSNYVRLYIPDYPESPLGFINKALEYFDYGDVGEKILLLYQQYKLLLSNNHREAIKSIDRMLGVFDEETSDQYLDWHVLAYITRGDYCANENLDYMEALKYYMAANELLSAPIHDGLKVKWLLLQRMQEILRVSGLFEEACQCGEILVRVSTKHSNDETAMRYVLDLCNSYLSAEKYDDLKNVLSYYRNEILQYEGLAYDYSIIDSKLAMHEHNYEYALNTLKSIDSENFRPSKKLKVYKYLLVASSHCSPQEAPEYADTVNQLLFSEIQEKLLRISPQSRRNWQGLCREAMQTHIEVANQGVYIAPQLLKMSLFKKGLLFRTDREIAQAISKDSHSLSEWKILINLRDSINHYINLGDEVSVKRFRSLADSIEWDLSYKVVNDSNLQWSFKPDINAVLKKMGSDDVALDFVSAKIGDKSIYSAIVFGKSQAPTYVPLFEYSDSIDYASLNKLWDSLKPYLNHDAEIYFCPDGILNNIGIEFLKDDDGIPMSQKYNLHRVFHLSDIQSHEGIGDKVVAVGVSDHNSPIGDAETIDRGTMTDLPNVAYEMRLIGQRLNPDCLTMLFNDDATEIEFKRLGGTDLSSLHISTHGIYRNYGSLNASAGNPDDDDYHIAQRMLRADKESLSGLILRQGNLSWKSDYVLDENDDILTSEEIENMTFPNLQLTVLSACDSGLGDIDSEGVWGLQRAFRIAGSKSLICSLKKIDDYWTAQFMDAFYEYAGQGKSIYESFHYAQKELFGAEPDNPDIWSSFILIE